jgi:hypothetical protein
MGRMLRCLTVVALLAASLAVMAHPASASDTRCKGFEWDGTPPARECIHVNGSGLKVNFVEGRFMGFSSQSFKGQIRHRLCINYPSQPDPCFMSPIYTVNCWGDQFVCHKYNFGKAGTYPHGTVMCTYTHDPNNNNFRLSGPACVTITK